MNETEGAVDDTSPAPGRPRAAPPGGEPPGTDRGSVALSFAMLAAGVALILLIGPLRHALSLALSGDLNGLHRDLKGLGFGGVVLLEGLMLAHAVIFYPSEIANAASGFVYGFFPGLALAMFGWFSSGLVAYFLGRALARRLLLALFGRRRFAALVRAIDRGGVPLLLAARLVPVVPYSLMCYAAGASDVPLWRFVWTSMVGYLPITGAVVYLGSRAQSLSLGDPIVWVIVAVGIAALAVSHRLGLRKHFD